MVLAGGYVEAGDTGRHRVEAGDVLLHAAWESHLDRFDGRGAEVLVLAVDDGVLPRVTGRAADPDAVARLAERDRAAAAALLLSTLGPTVERAADWPDLLARDLRRDTALCLAAWAEAHGLHAGSISRGFRQVFGLTPAAYRLAQRTGCAIRTIRGSTQPLSLIALDCGFADQAHMSRSIRRVAGATPARLRLPDAGRGAGE